MVPLGNLASVLPLEELLEDEAEDEDAEVVAGVGVGVAEVVVGSSEVLVLLTFWKNSAASLVEEGVGVGVEEVDGAAEVEGGRTVEIVSPTRTYLPFLSPCSTSSKEIAWPLSS
jgi:hypothetical protein